MRGAAAVHWLAYLSGAVLISAAVISTLGDGLAETLAQLSCRLRNLPELSHSCTEATGSETDDAYPLLRRTDVQPLERGVLLAEHREYPAGLGARSSALQTDAWDVSTNSLVLPTGIQLAAYHPHEVHDPSSLGEPNRGDDPDSPLVRDDLVRDALKRMAEKGETRRAFRALIEGAFDALRSSDGLEESAGRADAIFAATEQRPAAEFGASAESAADRSQAAVSAAIPLLDRLGVVARTVMTERGTWALRIDEVPAYEQCIRRYVVDFCRLSSFYGNRDPDPRPIVVDPLLTGREPYPPTEEELAAGGLRLSLPGLRGVLSGSPIPVVSGDARIGLRAYAESAPNDLGYPFRGTLSRAWIPLANRHEPWARSPRLQQPYRFDEPRVSVIAANAYLRELERALQMIQEEGSLDFRGLYAVEAIGPSEPVLRDSRSLITATLLSYEKMQEILSQTPVSTVYDNAGGLRTVTYRYSDESVVRFGPPSTPSDAGGPPYAVRITVPSLDGTGFDLDAEVPLPGLTNLEDELRFAGRRIDAQLEQTGSDSLAFGEYIKAIQARYGQLRGEIRGYVGPSWPDAP